MSPINPFVLVFTALAIYKLSKSPEAAALDVFLPVLFLVPYEFALHIPHLPPLSCADAVILPVGIGALLTKSQNWQFRRADLWVFLFTFAAGYTDFINIGFANALFNFPSILCDALLAYLIGKLLIEQGGLREQFAKRMVYLLAAVGAISVIEFVGRMNLFLLLGRRLMRADSSWGDQMRNGFLRAKGPFAGPEECGIILVFGLFFAIWLRFVQKTRSGANEPKYFGLTRSTWCVCAIGLDLYMTLSRGPWLGAVVAFLIARIGMVKKPRIAMILALLILTAGGVEAHIKTSELEHLSAEDVNDEQTGSAVYRTQLYAAYSGVAESGGLFGWSATAYPRNSHLDSIDNEYLLLWVTQGKAGIWLFVAIAVEGAVAIFLAIRRSRQRNDTAFYYSLAGTLVGTALVISTVFLTAQTFILFFFLIGWSQSLRDQFAEVENLPQVTSSRFRFKRVFA